MRTSMNIPIKMLLTSLGLLGIVLIVAASISLFAKPDIMLTNDVQKISENKATEIAAVKLQSDSCVESCTLPHDRYEIIFEAVDDRGWAEELLGFGYTNNGLTQVILKDKNRDRPFLVGTFLDTDPGSGRSYSVALSENGKYLTINGAVRTERGTDASDIREINYIFIIDEGKLYSR